MGDKSPKANQKHKAQQKAKALRGESPDFLTRKENPLTGIRACHTTIRCLKDSSRKGRRPRFEKKRGFRFQMTIIILRVAKRHDQNQP